ncbi:uncharacterized protein METZ01_LOCUS403377, partial [marine metagenome]
MGGLGNQLFQYALVRSIQNRFNIKYKFDLSWFEEPLNIHRPYMLDKFNINPEIAAKDDILNLIEKFWSGTLENFYKDLNSGSINDDLIISDVTDMRYKPSIMGVKKSAYFNGYWQSEKYFITNRHLLLKEIIYNKSLNKNTESLLEQIKKSKSVAVHIRRTGQKWKNSEHNPDSIDTHGLLDLDYYYTGLDYIHKIHDNLKIFIFSDQIDWVEQKFTYPGEITFVNNDDLIDGDLIDFIIMKSCK